MYHYLLFDVNHMRKHIQLKCDVSGWMQLFDVLVKVFLNHASCYV
jgi:hypothetical protein